MWIAFAFLSACLLGFYDVSKKVSLSHNAVIPVLLLNTLFCFLFFLPFILCSSTGILTPDTYLYVPEAGWESHKYIILKAIIVSSSWILGYFGIKHLPLTIAGPINATRPVIVLVGAMLIFGEQLNLWQWAGVLCAVVSFYMMSGSSRKEGIVFAHNKWIFCIVMAAVTGAVSALYDKFLLAPETQGGIGLNRMFVQAWSNFYQMVLMSVILVLVWMPRRKESTPFRWKWTIILISVFLSIADFAYYYALHYPDAMISIVSMVRRGSVLVSFFVGAFLLKEHNIKAKTLDLFLVLLSMIFLWIGTK